MGFLFFDTSALVKRYYEEDGTDAVDRLFESDDTVVISSLSVIETVSAFRRKYNREQIAESTMNQLLSYFFEEALDDMLILPMNESVLEFSFDLVLNDDLRTLDSLQLSAALILDATVEEVRLVAADRELGSIARQRGLDALLPGTAGG